MKGKQESQLRPWTLFCVPVAIHNASRQPAFALLLQQARGSTPIVYHNIHVHSRFRLTLMQRELVIAFFCWNAVAMVVSFHVFVDMCTDASVAYQGEPRKLTSYEQVRSVAHCRAPQLLKIWP